MRYSYSEELQVLEFGTKIEYVDRMDKFYNTLHIHLRETVIKKVKNKNEIKLGNGEVISYFQVKKFSNGYSYYYMGSYDYMTYLSYNLEKCKKKFLNNRL